jgi:hypothetical protein
MFISNWLLFFLFSRGCVVVVVAVVLTQKEHTMRLTISLTQER